MNTDRYLAADEKPAVFTLWDIGFEPPTQDEIDEAEYQDLIASQGA